MRVIAGSARGRRLDAPPGRGTRPTSDRVREAMFSSLAADIPGAVVLDLYAGTGALGIEALSRGAAAATFVERDAGVVAILTANVARADVADRATIVRGDAAGFVARTAGGPFTVVLCDPPYDVPLPGVLDLVAALDAGSGLAAGAVVVVERERRDPALADLDNLAGLPGVLAVDRLRSYGDTVLLYLRRAPDPVVSDLPKKDP